MKRILNVLLKLSLLFLALVIITVTAIMLYLSSPKLINRTLPVWLEVDDYGRHDHPRFAGALSLEELQERYGFEGTSLEEIKAYAESEEIRLKHQGHIIRRMVSDRPRDLKKIEVPPFDKRLFGYQILMLKEYPIPDIDLLISEHKWFDYYLVLEVVSD